MQSRLLPLSLAFISSFFCVACSDKPSEPSAGTESVEEVAGPVKKTAGRVVFDGLPMDIVSVVEVSVVSDLDDETRQRILRQRELFEYKITGTTEAAEKGGGITGVSPEDEALLTAKFKQLASSFPPVLIEDIDLGNNRLRKYQSDTELQKEYAYLFASIKLDNLERALNFIAKKLEADSADWVKKTKGRDEDGIQAVKTTLNWLESVHELYQEYVAFAKEYVDALNRYQKAQGGFVEPTDWNGYMSVYSNVLIVGTSKSLLSAMYLEDDGAFEIEGQGIIIVRIELGGASAYFLPGSPSESRVRIEGLRQFEQ